MVLLCDRLCTQVFLDRNRVISAAFYRSIVRYDDAFLAGDPADTADDAGSRD